MKRVSDENGITLIELLAAIAITGMLVLLITTIYFYVFDSLHTGQDRLSLQRDARNILNTLATEIRFAAAVDLYDLPQEITGFSCIYIEDSVLKQKTNGVEKVISSNDNSINNISFKIKEISEENYILSMRLIARRKNEEYELNTELLLDNLETYSGDLNTKRNVICYQNP